MQRFFKLLTIFVIGGISYGTVEVLFRGYTFVSMGVIGGICMVVIHLLNDERRNRLSLPAALLISTAFIVSIELLSGEIMNKVLNMRIWSYTSIPFNFDGQICLLFAMFWLILSFVGIVFDEWIRLKILHQKNYPIFAKRILKSKA